MTPRDFVAALVAHLPDLALVAAVVLAAVALTWWHAVTSRP